MKNYNLMYYIDGMMDFGAFDSLAEARRAIAGFLRADNIYANKWRGLRGMKRGEIARENIMTGEVRYYSWQ